MAASFLGARDRLGFFPPSYQSSSGSKKYTVLLIFNEEDSSEIPVTDICQSLRQENIFFSFLDEKLEEHLRIGRSSSRLAVVVVLVSKSYPTSVLCLNQLLTIVHTHDEGYISVLPVFYGVDPLNVRNQTGEFKEPFRKLGEEFPAEKVQAWRRALTKLTNIVGMDSRYWNKGDKVTDLIRDEILVVIGNYIRLPNLPSSTEPEGLVGMDRQVQVLYELLDLKATKEVRLIGIWGLGGIGKTTLARYVYKQMSSSFHAHMFVDDLKTVYTHVGEETEHAGTGVIKSTVGHRKGLLVIDSVNNMDQLKGIAEIVSWCSSGSRVILITQDKNLLDEFGVEHVYEVKSLRYDEALQLFSQSAFKKLSPPTRFQSLSLRAVEMTSFLPLTLKILGSSLQGKNEEGWEKELQKLEGDQEKTIMEIMKKSYTRPNRSLILPK